MRYWFAVPDSLLIVETTCPLRETLLRNLEPAGFHRITAVALAAAAGPGAAEKPPSALVIAIGLPTTDVSHCASAKRRECDRRCSS